MTEERRTSTSSHLLERGPCVPGTHSTYAKCQDEKVSLLGRRALVSPGTGHLRVLAQCGYQGDFWDHSHVIHRTKKQRQKLETLAKSLHLFLDVRDDHCHQGQR